LQGRSVDGSGAVLGRGSASHLVLAAGTYTIEATTHYAQSVGSYSVWVRWQAAAPPVPSSLSCTQDTDDGTAPFEVDCSWGGIDTPAVSRYELEVQRRVGTVWAVVFSRATTGTAYSPSLVAGYYRARVRASSPLGPWSNWSSGFTVTSVPSSLSCTQDTDDGTAPFKVDCTWGGIDTPVVSGYELEVQRRVGTDWAVVPSRATTATAYSPSLVAGYYRARVRAGSPVGPWSNWSSGFTVTPVPSSLSCTQDLSDSSSPYEVDCEWDRVTTPAVTAYQLQTRHRDGGGTWSSPASPLVTRSSSVTHSFAVNTYQARVRTSLPSEGAWSDWTEAFHVVVPTRPALPVGNCTSSTTGVQSTVTWTWSSTGSQVTYEITFTDPSEHLAGQDLWQDAGSRRTEGPKSNLTPGAGYAVFVRAKNIVGTSDHINITCNTPAPNGPSQYAEVQKIAHLGSVTGGYTLQQFKDEKSPSDHTNPTVAPYPYLTWQDDDCSIPVRFLVRAITGWGNEYAPMIIPGVPVPLAPTAPLKEGCWRHDFAWRNLYRIEQRYAVDSWNQTNYNLSNSRLIADWHDICDATYTGPGQGDYAADCKQKSTLAWTTLVALSSVAGYSSDVGEIGYE